MNRSIRTAVVAAVSAIGLSAVVITGFANAQTAAGQTATGQTPAPTERQAEFRDKMKERFASRARAIHDALGLRTDQEAAWSKLLAAMKRDEDAARPDRADMQALTTPERLDLAARHMAERKAEFDERSTAIRSFYGQLTAQQKKVFDAMPMMDRGHGMIHQMHHRGPGPGHDTRAN